MTHVSRPQSDMQAHVRALLLRHPRLVKIWEAGWSLELASDREAIWASATPASDAEVDSPPEAIVRIETPRWWLPPRSGRALAIAEGLAEALQKSIALPHESGGNTPPEDRAGRRLNF